MKALVSSFINQFKNWNRFETFLGFLAIVGSIVLTILWQDSLFGLSVTLTGVLCVILVSKRSQWNYFWGTYNVIGYAYLAYSWGLGGDFMLNAFYFLPMQLVGFMMWQRHLEKDSKELVKAEEYNKMQYIKLGIFTLTTVLLYSFFLQDVIAPFFNSLEWNLKYPVYDSYFLYLFDSMSTVLSVIAMYLMVKRIAAQWILWIIVNIASIGMWTIALVLNTEIGAFAAGGAPAMILMWSIYLINAFYGYKVWRKKAENQ
jgi:nicotinamide mononucleotide transporter